MKRLLALPMLIAALTIVSFASVNVTTPTSGATVQSPVKFVASATSYQQITSIAIFVDSQNVYQTNASSLNTSIAMSSGPHAIVVKAWNSEGKTYSESITLSVTSPKPTTPTPAPAPVVTPTPAPPTTGSATVPAGYSALIAATYTSNANYTSIYYVSASGSDSNAGTSSAPWATLSHATSTVSGCALVLVEPGTYTVSSGRTAKITNSGTSTCHTAYVATAYGSSILNTPNDNGNDAAIWITGTYVDLVGFDINNPMGCVGVYSNGNYVNITYNRIHDVANGSGVGCGNGVGGGGILGAIGASNYNNWSDNIVWNVGTIGNHFTHGLYTSSAHNTLQNNIVYAAGGACIQAYHQPSYDVITNNTLVGCGYNGFLFGADSGYSYSNSVFSNNAMSGNSGYDINACGASGCGVAIGSGNTFSNNGTASSGGNNIGDLSSVGQSLVNNLTSAPSFVNVASPASGGNFDVKPGSPLLTGGTAINAPKTDILGVVRNTVDPSIGAYED